MGLLACFWGRGDAGSLGCGGGGGDGAGLGSGRVAGCGGGECGCRDWLGGGRVASR
jgi:hypothetical protein